MKGIRGDLVTAIKTGNVILGSKSVISALLTENPRMVLISGNCAKDVKERIVYYSKLAGVPCHTAKEDGMEVASVCGKPFPVSALAVMDEGESSLLLKFQTDVKES